MLDLIVERKLVVRLGETRRYIFVNPRNNRQVSVYTVPSYEGDFGTLSIPIEGMNGWHVREVSMQEAWLISNLECYRRGKVYNRLVNFPRFFLQEKLF